MRILNDVGRDPAGTPPWIRFGVTRELAQGAQGPESKCPGCSLINSHMLCTCSWPDFTILAGESGRTVYVNAHSATPYCPIT